MTEKKNPLATKLMSLVIMTNMVLTAVGQIKSNALHQCSALFIALL